MLNNHASATIPKSRPSVGIASHPDKLKASLRLVYHAYLRNGLIQPNPYAMRISPYHLEPTTEVFMVALREEITCTMTLVRDGKQGLPMETIFAEEVAWRREQGIPCAEVSCLADLRENPKRGFPLLIRLMSFTAQCAKYRGIDELLIAVHPKHSQFYQRFLGFRLVSSNEKSYQAVCGNPAVALTLDMPRLSIDSPDAYDRLFGRPFDEEDLRYRPISDELRAELSTMVEATYTLDPCEDTTSCLREPDLVCV